MTTPLLQLTSVAKSFGAVRALKGVSFDLRAGEVHALLGENGAGKSTLIKVITGAHQPDGGSIEINGERVAHLTPASARKLGIACIYQQPALFPDLTVAENIGLRLESPKAFKRVQWSERREQAQKLLQRIGAEISPDAEIRLLSMPEQQLVEIACALGAGARIVIMDEPTASLTQKETHLLFAVVRDLRQSGVGVIYISHRLEEIFTVADRVTVLRDGESVGTNQVGDMNEASLIKLMVGREVSHIYPPAESVAGEVVLSLKNLGSQGGGVKDVSLEVRAGEILGLAGLVGAGRTELARVLFGITPADTGEILLNGQRVMIHSPQEAVAHGIAYVPEDRRRHGIILEMPIAQNMTMAIHRRIFPGTWLRFGAEKQLALEFVRDLGVKAYGPEAPGGSLSGGNQQKVSLARWLATKPKLLILDEPTQGVDVGAKSEIHKIIRRLAKDGLAVLMISSDLPEILGMSDRIAVMRGGTITATLTGKSDAHSVMTAALGQAGGLPEISRGLSAATPPDAVRKTQSIPKGCENDRDKMGSTFLSLHYHIVFSTKERRPFIKSPWRSELHQYLGGAVRGLGGIPEIIGGVEDHIHLLVGLRATHCLADCMRELKKASSIWAAEKYEQDFSWQEGYAAFSVSWTHIEAVRQYIATQEAHHRKMDFVSELKTLLEKNGVEYEEKYLL